MEFELAYFKVAVKHSIYYVTRTTEQKYKGSQEVNLWASLVNCFIIIVAICQHQR